MVCFHTVSVSTFQAWEGQPNLIWVMFVTAETLLSKTPPRYVAERGKSSFELHNEMLMKTRMVRHSGPGYYTAQMWQSTSNSEN